MYCKCHGKSILEVKCRYNICNSFIKEDINKCSFLSTDNGEATINKGHKYYTQVISQIQLSQSNQGYFIVWTTKDSFIEIVGKNEAFWEKVFINLDFFQKICCNKAAGNQSIEIVVLVKKCYSKNWKSVQRKQICEVFIATNVEFGITVSAKKFSK